MDPSAPARDHHAVSRRRTWGGLALVAAVSFALTDSEATAPIDPAQPTFQTIRAATFIDTLGINIHIGSNPYNDPNKLAGMLRYLGIKNVRQSSPIDAAGLDRMRQLGRLGAKFDLIVNGGGPVDLKGAMQSVHDMTPYLNAVEGVNEAALYPITYQGKKGIDAAVSLQKDLYSAVRRNPALNNVAVYMFTIGGADPSAFPSIGDLSAHADFANVHSYPPHGLRPIFVIHAAIDGGRISAATKPVVVTETGFYTLPDHVAWGGVPDTVQASYLLSLVLDEAAAGVARTYLYDLIDDGPDPERVSREDNFGLFRFDGTPKLAAKAIHNFTTILADATPIGGSVLFRSLSGTAVGVPYHHTGNALALQKRDGSHVLVLWNEQQVWEPDTRTASTVTHIPVDVSLGSSYPTIRIYDPLIGTDPVHEYHGLRTLTVDLADHPIMLVLPPVPIWP